MNYSLTGLRGPRPAHVRDLHGFTFTCWTVVSWAGMKSGRAHWNCWCDCGTQGVVAHAALMNLLSKSCGKTAQCTQVLPSYAQIHNTEFVNRVGREYGNLTVLRHQGKVGNFQYWQCRCTCGSLVSKSSGYLTNQAQPSCGHEVKLDGSIFSRFEQQKEDDYVMMSLWLAILRENKGRVCERWLTSFDYFRADVGKQPSPRHRLSLVDWSGDWSGFNCVWTEKDMDVRSRRE